MNTLFTFFKKREVLTAFHFGGMQQGFDDKNWHLLVHRNYKRTNGAWFFINQVIALRPAVNKTCFLKNTHQRFVVDPG